MGTESVPTRDDVATSQYCVVMVDDDPHILQYLQHLTRHEPYRFLCAASGSAALKLIAETAQVAVIISDQWMPEMNGTEFLVRSRELAPDAIRMLLTGYSDTETVIAAMNACGATKFLRKPWQEPELLYAIRDGLAQYHLLRENSRQQEVIRNQNAKLHASVERHKITLRAIGDAVISTDSLGRVETVNTVAENLTGWTQAEATGKPLDEVFSLINEETRIREEDRVAKVLREGRTMTLANHALLVAKDGREIPISDSAAPIRDESGAITGVVLVFRDQTEERRVHHLLQARLTLLDCATTHSLDELLTKALDVVGNLVNSPIGFYHFVDSDQTNLSLQQWSTRTLNEFCRAEGYGMHYPVDQAGVWADGVREAKPVVHNDYASLPHKRGLPAGHATVIREMVVPIMREGKVVAILGVGNKPTEYTDSDVEMVAYLADVTWEIVEHKRADEKLRMLNSELEFRVEKRTAELKEEIHQRKKAQDELVFNQQQLKKLNAGLGGRVAEEVRKNREKDQVMIHQSRLAGMGEVISNIAHQWRQPLNNLGLMIQGLESLYGCGELTAETLRHEIESAMGVISFMSHTIDDFRLFYRKDREKTRFSVNGAVDKALNLMRSDLERHGITIRVEAPEELEIEGFANEYSQAMFNIISNARDVLLERQVQHPELSIRISGQEGRSAVIICDNGGGIDPDILPRIFDPYFSTKFQAQGTGIGLYMAKVIIEKNMGGEIRAANGVDGAEFRVIV